MGVSAPTNPPALRWLLVPDSSIAAHLPGEDAIIALAALAGKLIDGQTPAQKAILWQNWIDFWAPLVALLAPAKPTLTVTSKANHD